MYFRAEFEQMAAPLFEKIRVMLQRLLTETKKKPADIESIEIIGGASRMPMVKQLITDVRNLFSFCSAVEFKNNHCYAQHLIIIRSLKILLCYFL